MAFSTATLSYNKSSPSDVLSSARFDFVHLFDQIVRLFPHQNAWFLEVLPALGSLEGTCSFESVDYRGRYTSDLALVLCFIEHLLIEFDGARNF